MLLICIRVALAAVLVCWWCIVLYCSAPYMPAPLIAGNSRGFTDVSRGAWPALGDEGGVVVVVVVVLESVVAGLDNAEAGTMPNRSLGLGGCTSKFSLRTISASWPLRSMMYLKNSYVDQQIAVAGIEYNTLGNIPLKKPLTPAVSRI